jgi:hypothetical protein
MICGFRARSLLAAGALSCLLVAALAGCGTSTGPSTDPSTESVGPAESTVEAKPGLSTRDFCAAMPAAAKVKDLTKLSVQEPKEIFRMSWTAVDQAAIWVRCLYLVRGKTLADDMFGGKMGFMLPGSMRVEVYTGVTDQNWEQTILEGLHLLMGDEDGPPTPADLGDAAKFTNIMSVTDLTEIILTVRKGSQAISIDTDAGTGHEDLVKVARAILATL